MPTVFIEGPYAFRFYTSDQSEPIHIHVVHDDREAKFWLNPLILASNFGFSSHEVLLIRTIIEHRSAEIEARWKEYFSEQ